MLNHIHEANFSPGTISIHQRFVFSHVDRLLVLRPPLILSDEKSPQPPRQQRRQEHEQTAHGHTLHIVRLIAVRIESRTHQGSELPQEIQHHDASPSLRVGVLVVDRPGEDEGDGGEEARGRGVDTDVSPSRVGFEDSSDRDQEVAETAEEGMENYIKASIP